ncbi:MAG TPA: DUF924 family protein [bacterium]|nr:DUF924 family protein [bacterium]
MNDAGPLIEYWFGEIKEDPAYIELCSKRWFGGSESTDSEIKDRFEHDLRDSIEGKREDWKNDPKGCLGLILLWDQFPRNMYRDTPRSFAYDMLAQNLCLKELENKTDNKLHPLERVFFYLPLEHAENLEMQKLSVACFRQLARESTPALKKAIIEFCDYAVKHFKIIQKFGRFPHRNAILNRPSTPREIAFLKKSGSSF